MVDDARSLLRTNIKLTGNVKLALHTDVIEQGDNNKPAICSVGDVYLEPIESILPTYNIKANLYSSSYEYDIHKYYEYYKDFFYTLNDGTDKNKNNNYYLSENIKDNHKSNFEFGCKRVSYEKNKYQFSFFAPLYLSNPNEFPDTFVITLKYKNNQNIDVKKYIKIDLYKNELWNKYITKYLNKLDDKVIKLDVNTFNSYYFGIDVAHGGFIKAKDNISKTLFANELTINEFDNIITNSFMKNNMVMSQILNLSFYFNINNEVFSDINFGQGNIFDYFNSYEVSGHYEKDGNILSFWDIDFNYEEEYINNYTSIEEVYKNDKTNKNVFDLLGENTYTDFKYLCKQIPQINKWCLLGDEKYRLNLSEAYSTEKGYYGNTLPFNELLPQSIKIGDGDNYRYSFDWFEMPRNILFNTLPTNIYKKEEIKNYLYNFLDKDSLSIVKQNTTIYKGFQYVFDLEKKYDNYKFGIILVPVKNFINNDVFLKYDNELIEIENDGIKYIFYTILLNLPVISDYSGYINITPEILNNIYYNGVSIDDSTDIFNIITPYNPQSNFIEINKIKYNSLISAFEVETQNNNFSLGKLKQENEIYINELKKYYDSSIIDTFSNVLFLSLSDTIGNNVLYIDFSSYSGYDQLNANRCNNIYYLDITVAKRIEKLYFKPNIIYSETIDDYLNEAEMLMRLLGLIWVRNDNIHDNDNPQYVFKKYEDILYRAINSIIDNTSSVADKKFKVYLQGLLNNSIELSFNWKFIKENILSNGLLLDSTTKLLYTDINSTQLTEINYQNILISNNIAYFMNYSINDNDNKNILEITNLGDDLLISSISPVWKQTLSYTYVNILYNNGKIYMIDIDLKNTSNIIESSILNLIPKYNTFTTFQKPHLINLQKRLLKVPISIINKSDVKETDIKIYKNSIYTINLYRYMGFIIPKMRKVIPEGGYIYTNNTKNTKSVEGISYIKNYFQKKIKNTPNILLSYTSQTDYLPVYESINEYTLYQNEVEIKFKKDLISEDLDIIKIKGIDINKYTGARVYNTFDKYKYIKPVEYKYFNTSKIYFAATEIKIIKDKLNQNLTAKEILYNYITNTYNFLKLTNDEINYIVELYKYTEKLEYDRTDKASVKTITRIIYTLK